MVAAAEEGLLLLLIVQLLLDLRERGRRRSEHRGIDAHLEAADHDWLLLACSGGCHDGGEEEMPAWV